MAASQYGSAKYQRYYSATDGPANMSQDSITMSMWVNFEFKSSNPMFSGTGDSTQVDQNCWMTLLSSGKFRYALKDTSQTNVESSSTYNLDTWYFVAGVSYANNDHKLFVDGVEVGNSTVTKTYTVSPDRWSIGINSGNINYNQDFYGYMAYPQFFDRGLSAEEVNEIMHKPYSIGKGLVWAPDMLVNSPSVIGDIKDLGPGGFDCNQGLLPSSQSTLGPPVYFPELETV